MIVYELRLADGCWYVGKVERADDLDGRVAQHRAGEGAQWTRLHAVEALERTTEGQSEDAIVLALMAEYGIDRVRGGTFCTPVLDDRDRRVLEKMVASLRGTCYQCRKRGHCTNECPVSLDMAARRGGDWECPKCGNDVFAKHQQCPKCQKWRPRDAKIFDAVPGQKRGDWNCPACGDHQFAKNATCRKCGAAKPAANVAEWKCPSCGAAQAGKDIACQQCSADRPANPKRPSEAPAEEKEDVKKLKTDVKSGDWMCAGCQAHNFASRKVCFKCQKAKPREDAEVVTDCVFCLTRPVSYLIKPCNHLCLCDECQTKLDTSCPICRGPVSSKERVYQ